ncbi:MAG TPA: response regulator [Verrucomicrobiae bacterium]|nr:response regulator [Verrucomicrobiae bacterium]
MTSSVNNGPLHILAAEDNPDDLFLLREAFKKAAVTSSLHDVGDGLQVVAYLTGRDAFADRGVYPFPHILLLDINMPGMNGFEVLQWIRGDPECGKLTVHILSASSRQSDVQRAYELRANSYVVKPSRLSELVKFAATLHEWHRVVALP